MLGGEIFIVVAAAWQQNKRVTRPASSQYRRVKSCVTLVMSYSQLTLTYSAGNPDSLFQYLKPILYFIDVAHVIECMFMLIAVIMLITPALTLPGYYCNYHTLFSSSTNYISSNITAQSSTTIISLKSNSKYRNTIGNNTRRLLYLSYYFPIKINLHFLLWSAILEIDRAWRF